MCAIVRACCAPCAVSTSSRNSRSTGLSSGASKPIGLSRRAKQPIAPSIPSTKACGNATPSPVAVDPSFSRSNSKPKARTRSNAWLSARRAIIVSKAWRRERAVSDAKIESNDRSSSMKIMTKKTFSKQRDKYLSAAPNRRRESPRRRHACWHRQDRSPASDTTRKESANPKCRPPSKGTARYRKPPRSQRRPAR